MADIRTFNYGEFGKVRVHVDAAGEPWFVAKDILEALRYSETYTTARALNSVPEAWKGVHPMNTLGGNQEMLTISEQGLRFFLGRSDKPEAISFQKWTEEEVLPALKGAVAPHEPYSPKEISVMQTFEGTGLGRVRVHIDAAGEPWFVAKDILEALEYSETYIVTTAFQNVPENWKGMHRMHTLGGEQEVLTISEQGLYFFLGRSDKPKALPFQKWVAGEVLPSIRKTGRYVHDGYVLPRIPQSFSDALRMIADIEDEKQKALAQRDYFKRTKAEIGTRREATAMNTASQLSKENASLKNQLGDGKEWKAAKAVPWVKEYFVESRGFWSQFGKKLTAISREMHVEVRRLETSDYPEGVGLYRTDVIDELRRRLEYDRNMLRKWRR